MPEAYEPRSINAPDDTRDVVAELVERYRRNADQYAAVSYREAQLRQEFIDPFFEALGWDIANEQGYAEPYKEVIHEDAIKVRGATKAPDYCFRIGGQRKFFLEAKKPSVHIKTDPSPAYQLRRYGWSAKLPLSILTDFEEFAVYDCSKRPQEADGPSVARVDFITYDEYVDRLDDIYSIFAKEAILKGSFDRYAEGTRRKRGTTEVDSEFLQEIEQWREMLAKDIARHNLDLSVHDLNFAVQTTIDRILFFRIAEDRGVEPYGRLRDLLDGTGLYPRLCQLYQQADTKYNAGLFDFSSSGDQLTPELEVSDKALQSILAELYYPQCPYEFSVLGADILGAVYEQFLGKVIRLTPSHRAKVEEKPEVKKAGGVYYTPTYIVDYIVEHTVGPALEEAETPEAASKLRILDPACGSGSFLLGAYQYLLNWHLDYYTNHSPRKHARGPQPAIIQVLENEWRLSTFERKRILLNNIFGVDIDSQAVEVTKLNLLLKCMEGETEETLSGQLQLAQERVLPNIDDNIKCGNSLIGPDYYEGRQLALIDEEEARRVNAFDWDAEFPEIMSAGGFDCVIGNPPYIRIHRLVDFYPTEVRYIQTHFRSAIFGKVDIYVAFIELALQVLRSNGQMGFIVPNKFLQADYGVGLRQLLTKKCGLQRIVDFQAAQVFEGATSYTCLVFATPSPQDSFLAQFNPRDETPQTLLGGGRIEEIDVGRLGTGPWTLGYRDEQDLCQKLDQIGQPLPALASEMITGVKTGANDVFVLEAGEIPNGIGIMATREEGSSCLKKYLKAESLKRYYVGPSARHLIYPYALEGGATTLLPEATVKASAPEIWQRLRDNQSKLQRREKGKMKGPAWYGLSFSSSMMMFESTKIVTPTLAPANAFALDDSGLYFPQGAGGGMGIVIADKALTMYVLGVLNSRVLTFYLQKISSRFQGGWFAYEPRYVKRLPIRTIDFDDPADVARHDKMVELVETMLELHKRLAQVKTPRSRERLQRQIAATDQAIDKLVYELYELSDEEIAIVEGQT